MLTAKDLLVKPISRQDADAIVKRLHYSGKVVNNSQLSLGVFIGGRCEGAMQFGPSLDKKRMQLLVRDTPWNGFMELNRMAFSEALPRNSESRALGVALRMFRRMAPHVQWIVSFADGTQCGDGTIYRAAGFSLVGLRRNQGLLRIPGGGVIAKMTVTSGAHSAKNGGGAAVPTGLVPLPGFQLKYIYFLDPTARARLTAPVLPFSAIAAAGASMYRGRALVAVGGPASKPADVQTDPGAPK